MDQLTKEESQLLLQIILNSKFNLEGKFIMPLAMAMQKLNLIIKQSEQNNAKG